MNWYQLCFQKFTFQGSANCLTKKPSYISYVDNVYFRTKRIGKQGQLIGAWFLHQKTTLLGPKQLTVSVLNFSFKMKQILHCSKKFCEGDSISKRIIKKKIFWTRNINKREEKQNAEVEWSFKCFIEGFKTLTIISEKKSLTNKKTNYKFNWQIKAFFWKTSSRLFLEIKLKPNNY